MSDPDDLHTLKQAAQSVLDKRCHRPRILRPHSEQNQLTMFPKVRETVAGIMRFLPQDRATPSREIRIVAGSSKSAAEGTVKFKAFHLVTERGCDATCYDGLTARAGDVRHQGRLSVRL